jgi:hypothetical protein
MLRRLQRRDENVGVTARAEHPGDPSRDLRRDATAVGPPVESEIGPTVRILGARERRQVRGIAHDPVDGPDPVGQVGADRHDLEALAARGPHELGERTRVPVSGDHPGAGAGRRESQGAVPGAEVEEPARAGRRGERPKQLGILARRVDARRLLRGGGSAAL